MWDSKIFLHYKQLDGKVHFTVFDKEKILLLIFKKSILKVLINYFYLIYIFTGIFGFIGISIAIIPLNYITAPPPFADNSRGTLEATVEALIQIGSNNKLLIAVIGQSIIFLFVFFLTISFQFLSQTVIWDCRYII